MLALLFVTLPFVVRAVQPVLIELDREMEEAAASLGRALVRRLPADRLPESAAGDPLGGRARVRAGDRRVRRGRADLREHPLQDGGLVRLHLPAASSPTTAPARRPCRCCCSGSRSACCWHRRVPPLEDAARQCLEYVLRFAALGYLAFLLLVPVGFVFYRAFGTASPMPGTPSRPGARIHALELTLLLAAIAVPANTIIGIILALDARAQPLRRARAAERGRRPAARALAGRGRPRARTALRAWRLARRPGGTTACTSCSRCPEWCWRRCSSRCRSSFARSCPCCARSAPSRSRRRRRSARGRSRSSAGSRSRRSAGPSPTGSCSPRPAASASSVRSASSRARIEGKTETLPLYVQALYDVRLQHLGRLRCLGRARADRDPDRRHRCGSCSPKEEALDGHRSRRREQELRRLHRARRTSRSRFPRAR